MLEVYLLCVCLLCSALPASAQSSLNRDLSFSLPFVIVFVIVVVMFVVVVYMLYRAKRGYFCCLKPMYTLPPSARMRQDEGDEEEAGQAGESSEPAASSALPPTYQHGRPADIAPPDYRDALQDQIIGQPAHSPTYDQTTAPELSTEAPRETTPTDTLREPEVPPSPEAEEVDLVVPAPEEASLEDSADNYDDTTPLNP